MSELPMVQSILYFSEDFQRQGPLPLLRRFVDLGAVGRDPGPDGQPYDLVEKCQQYPEQTRFCFIFQKDEFWLTPLQESGHLLLAGAADFVEETSNEAVAQKLRRIAEEAASVFLFKYGYVDLQGGKLPSEKAIAAVKLTTYFWVNFFGPQFVTHYGKEFLMRAPGFAVRELPNGTVQYTSRPSVFAPTDLLLESRIVTYFAAKSKLRRHQPVPER